jgi:phosphoribosylformylglycinamidine synthase subunit PurS
MPYKAKIKITLRKSILDVQGKAVQHALESLGYSDVSSVRIGKYIELELDDKTLAAAKKSAEEACQKLLANSVMEDYSVDVEQI